MTAGESIRAHLLTDGAVAVIVDTRIYPVRALQESSPVPDRMIYKLTGWSRDKVLSGGQSNLNHTDWELHCQSADYDTAHELAAAAIASLDQFRGVMAGGVNVQSCMFEDAVDDDDPALGIFSVVLRFSVSYS